MKLIPVLAAALSGLLLTACSAPQSRPSPPGPAVAASVPSAIEPAPAPIAPALRSTPATTPTAPVATSLGDRINRFIAQPRFRHAEWGINVVDLDSSQVRYSHQPQKLFVPASNTKLYTAALVLDTLGPDTRFATTLLTTASGRRGNALHGDLVLRGGGDPSLGDSKVAPSNAQWADNMAAALSRMGITRIEGDLIGDDTYFSGPAYGNGWEADDLQTAYAPPVSALSTDGNGMAIMVRRDQRGCCTVQVTPDALGSDIVNLTRHSSAVESGSLAVSRMAGSNKIWVSGTLPSGRRHQRIAQSVPDPARLAVLQLRQALSRHGITVRGRVRVLHWPQTGPIQKGKKVTVLARASSPPLRRLVQHMLKKSDNFYAQTLLLQAGIHLAHVGTCPDRIRTPATSEQWGLCAMRMMLARIGLDRNDATFSEGSGLSRRNLVSPQATTALLIWAQGQPFAHAFIDSLPIAGVDGTLKYRMIGTVAENRVYAKTGTLTHAYALAGYVRAGSGLQTAFALSLDRYQRPRDAMGRRLPPSPSQDLDAIAVMVSGARAAPDRAIPPATAKDQACLEATPGNVSGCVSSPGFSNVSIFSADSGRE